MKKQKTGLLAVRFPMKVIELTDKYCQENNKLKSDILKIAIMRELKRLKIL